MKKVFPIIIDKGDIFKQLSAKKREFLDSDYSIAAIDISNASIPNSTQLGEITVIIKTATKRNGSTFIYTNNEDAIDLLDQVHFSSIANVIKDKNKFKEILQGDLKTAEVPKSKKIIPPQTNNNHNSNEKIKQIFKSPSYLNFLLIILLIFNLILSIGTVIFTNAKISNNRKILKAIIDNDKKLDQKTETLSRKIKELELLNEISE